jgi:hypothetical protein
MEVPVACSTQENLAGTTEGDPIVMTEASSGTADRRNDQQQSDRPPWRTAKSVVEQVLNASDATEPARDEALATELQRLHAEVKFLSQADLKMTLGSTLGLFFRGGKLDQKTQDSVSRQARLQAELATVRFQRGVSWLVTDIALDSMRATAIASECVAELAMFDPEWAQVLHYPDVPEDSVTWETSTARHWMHQYLLPVLPGRVREHLCATLLESAAYSGSVTTQDYIYLPSHADLGKFPSRWGTLDGRSGSFWLRDVGRGNGRDGRLALAGNDSYNPMVYRYGLQPMVTLDLRTFPDLVSTPITRTEHQQ